MSFIRHLAIGLRGLLRKPAVERELDDELAHFVEMEVQEQMRNGLTRPDAERAARVALGSVDAVKENVRAAGWEATLESVWRDAWYAARALRKNPTFTIAAALTLALGIGATTAVFSIVNAVLLRALPYGTPAGLVWIESVRTDRPDAPFSLPEFMDFRERAHHTDLAAFGNWSATFATTEAAVRLQGMRISANAFEVLGASPSAGRLLLPADDAPEADRVTVLSYAFWQRQFGGDGGAVGQAIRLNGEPHTIVGVLPQQFPWPLRDVDVVVPLSPDRDPRRHVRNSVNFLRVVGRLRGSATAAESERELTGLTKELRSQYPTEYARKVGVRLTPFQQYLVGDYRQILVVLFACVSLMLGIAFANVLNLLLIRSTARQSEMAVRRALGASAGDIARQLMMEGAWLAGAGGVAGGLVAYWAVTAVKGTASLNVLRLGEAHVDTVALAFVTGLMLIATAVFSMAPLGVVLRGSPISGLRGSGRTNATTRSQGRLWGAFIVTEISLAVILTSATVTMLDSLVRLERVDLGYRTDSVFVARLSLPPMKYSNVGEVVRFYESLSAALESHPGVVAAGVTSIAPLSGLLSAVPFTVVGQPPESHGGRPSANFRAISPGYLTAIRAALVTGRQFTEQDDESTPPVAIISSALANRYLPPSDIIGRQLLVDDNDSAPRPITVVGVVLNLRHVQIDGQPTYDIFIPLRQIHRDGLSFVTGNQFWTVRLATDPSAYGPLFSKTLRAVDADAATSGLGTMQAYVDAALATRRFSVKSLLGFAAIALVLATLGVYGVMAHGVEQRRREIGIRLAMGASSTNVRTFVLRRALGLTAVGVLLGLGGVLLTERALGDLLFGTTPSNPMLLGGVAILLIATSAVASWIPARRASRVDPVVVLAGE